MSSSQACGFCCLHQPWPALWASSLCVNSLDVLWSVGIARLSFWALRTHAPPWEAAGFYADREGGLPFSEGVGGGTGL